MEDIKNNNDEKEKFPKPSEIKRKNSKKMQVDGDDEQYGYVARRSNVGNKSDDEEFDDDEFDDDDLVKDDYDLVKPKDDGEQEVVMVDDVDVEPEDNIILNDEEKNAKRSEIIIKIVETQRLFSGSLTILQCVLLPAIQNIIPDKQIVSRMKSAILGMTMTNKELAQDLYRTLDETDDIDKVEIGKILLEFIPFFKLDGKYILVHQKAKPYLERVMTSKEHLFVGFQKFLSKQGEKQQTLRECLSFPLGRINLYQDLLCDLVKITPENHPDYQKLVDSFAELNKVFEAVQNDIEQSRNRDTIRRIQMLLLGSVQEKVVGTYGEELESIIKPGRLFIRKGQLDMNFINKSTQTQYDSAIFGSNKGAVQQSKKAQKSGFTLKENIMEDSTGRRTYWPENDLYDLYLFNDILIYSHPNRNQEMTGGNKSTKESLKPANVEYERFNLKDLKLILATNKFSDEEDYLIVGEKCSIKISSVEQESFLAWITDLQYFIKASKTNMGLSEKEQIEKLKQLQKKTVQRLRHNFHYEPEMDNLAPQQHDDDVDETKFDDQGEEILQVHTVRSFAQLKSKYKGNDEDIAKLEKKKKLRKSSSAKKEYPPPPEKKQKKKKKKKKKKKAKNFVSPYSLSPDNNIPPPPEDGRKSTSKRYPTMRKSPSGKSRSSRSRSSHHRNRRSGTSSRRRRDDGHKGSRSHRHSKRNKISPPPSNA